MLQMIHDAGFKPVPEDMRLTVTGKVEQRGDVLVIALDKMKAPKPVVLTIVPHASSPETAPHLARHVGDVIEAEGYWLPNESGKLAVTALRVQGEPGGRHPA
jgi:hypothetical protein